MLSGAFPFSKASPIDKIYRCIKREEFEKFWGIHLKT